MVRSRRTVGRGRGHEPYRARDPYRAAGRGGQAVGPSRGTRGAGPPSPGVPRAPRRRPCTGARKPKRPGTARRARSAARWRCAASRAIRSAPTFEPFCASFARVVRRYRNLSEYRRPRARRGLRLRSDPSNRPPRYCGKHAPPPRAPRCDLCPPCACPQALRQKRFKWYSPTDMLALLVP